MTVRRIYCETLSFEEVVRPRTMELLARYRLALVLAVRPWQIGSLPTVARAAARAEVPLAIWPMLADGDGRWVSAGNAERFAALVRALVGELAPRGLSPAEVMVDLEPPFAEVRALSDLPESRGLRLLEPLRRLPKTLAVPSAATFARGGDVLGALTRELRAQGIATSAAVWPLVALDRPRAATWQALLGTPVDALGADRVSVMMYTTILEGWSRRSVRRSDALALLDGATRRTMIRFAGAGISLGCVGTGALADEPIYASPRQLAEDVAVARRAGCTDLSLFELGGVLARAPAEAWLEAFTTEDHPARVATTARVGLARAVARTATRVVRATLALRPGAGPVPR